MNKNRLISSRFRKKNSKIVESSFDSIKAKYSIELQENIKRNYILVSDLCFCGNQDDYLIAEYDRYGILINSVLCSNCGTVRINPYLNQDSAGHFYTNIYQGLYGRSIDKEAYFFRQQKYGYKYYSIASKYLSDKDWVLEIGCGAGGALSVFQDKGFRVVGVDYDQALLDYGKDKGVSNLYYGSLNELKENLTFKAKLIYLNHVFEHLVEPSRMLEDCKDLLDEDGIIIMAMPDLLGIKLNDAYGGDLLNMIHIAHKYNYSFDGIGYLANANRYKVKRLFPDPSIKTHTSNAGEMWVLLENDQSSLSKTKIPKKQGIKVLNKLILYERKYQSSVFFKKTNKNLIQIVRKAKRRISLYISKTYSFFR